MTVNSMDRKTVIKLIDKHSGLIISVPDLFIREFKDLKAAFLFAWIMKRCGQSDGWVTYPLTQIVADTLMSEAEISRARKTLRQYGVIIDRKSGMPTQLQILIQWERVGNMYSNTIPFEFVSEPVKKVKQKSPTAVFKMKEVFDDEYQKAKGYSYLWQTSGKAGKDWKGLKMLYDQLLEHLQNKGFPHELDDVLNSFRMILTLLPKYHRERNYTPMLLYSNLAKIIDEIYQANNAKRQSTANPTGASYA